MTFVITQPCIDTTDQSCVEVCPVDCIHFEEGADRMLYINPLECIDCGACQPACPVSAIFPVAEVPADQTRFTPINELWYSDRAAARSQVGGGAAVAATPGATPAVAATAATAAPAAATAVTAAFAPTTSQHPIEEPHHHGAVSVPQYSQPSTMGLVTLVGAIVGWIFIVFLQGPTLLQVGSGLAITPPIGPTLAWGGGVTLGFLLGAPMLLFFLGGFLDSQLRDISRFDAKRPRTTERWRREGRPIWGRSEESRRADQQRAVHAVADTRFSFPSPQHPTFRTYVNVPQPTMALEFGGGGGEKVFPDILVVEYPGNYPVMVAQIETRETVSRLQAEHVWKPLQSQEAPLYIYVPAGMGNIAKDYAKAAGVTRARIRTWRRQPDGVIVQEI